MRLVLVSLVRRGGVFRSVLPLVFLAALIASGTSISVFVDTVLSVFESRVGTPVPGNSVTGSENCIAYVYNTTILVDGVNGSVPLVLVDNNGSLRALGVPKQYWNVLRNKGFCAGFLLASLYNVSGKDYVRMILPGHGIVDTSINCTVKSKGFLNGVILGYMQEMPRETHACLYNYSAQGERGSWLAYFILRMGEEVSRYIDRITSTLYVITGLASFTSTLSLVTGLRREITILGAIGVSMKRLISVILAYIVLTGVFGSVFGVSLGLVVSQFLAKTLFWVSPSLALYPSMNLHGYLHCILMVFSSYMLGSVLVVVFMGRVLSRGVIEYGDNR